MSQRRVSLAPPSNALLTPAAAKGRCIEAR